MARALSTPLRERLAGSVKEAAWLFLLAVAVTTAGWFLRAERLPLRADAAFYANELAAPLVHVGEALRLYEEGTHYFVDIRPGAPRDAIPGAFRVRGETFADDLYAQRDFLFPEDPVILYGDGSLQAASAVAARLQERGFVDVQILASDLAAWRAAGGPLTEEDGG
jgi:rhodanese-related sulfurtransferase